MILLKTALDRDNFLLPSFCYNHQSVDFGATDSILYGTFVADGQGTSSGFECFATCVGGSAPTAEKRSRIQGYEVAACGNNMTLTFPGEHRTLKSHPGQDGVSQYENNARCEYNIQVSQVKPRLYRISCLYSQMPHNFH